MSIKKPTLLRLLSETSRIITTHPLHFLSLSALFIFPISLLTTLYPHTSLQPNYNQFLPTPHSQQTEPPSAAPKPHLQLQIHYTSLAIISNVLSISSITRSTINALQDHPVQLVASLKSIPDSFFPILGTSLVFMITEGLIFFASSLCTMLPFVVFALLGGIKTENLSTYSYVVVYLQVALGAAVMLYFGLQWCLMYPVVVLESLWGFAPLKRSSYLVDGMRRVVFLMMMALGVLSLLVSMWYKNLMAEGRTCWVLLQMVVCAGLGTMSSIFNIVAYTVFFVYCKELHGETVSWTDGTSGVEYVKVPLDVV